MVDTYDAGTDVEACVDLEDRSGAQVVPDSATYRVLDADDAEVVASTVIVLVGDEIQLSAVISAVSNALDTGEYRDYRRVEFTFLKDSDTFVKHFDYIIDAPVVLVIGSNSYQTYGRALVTAADVGDIPWFTDAALEVQTRALADAYSALGTMAFTVLNVRQAPMTALTAAELTALDVRFLKALRVAQLVEANETLDPESIHQKRVAGLMAESIGESSMMFRPEKVMNNQPLTRRSMMILSEWLDWTLGIGRA